MWKAEKPNKYRICLDAASKVRGINLNGQVLSGPDLLNNLTGVILRWRRKQFPITSDVKGFFHQIFIDPKDDATYRFLWFEDESMENIVEYEHVSHIFGAASSPAVAAFTLKYHAEKVNHLFDSDIK